MSSLQAVKLQERGRIPRQRVAAQQPVSGHPAAAAAHPSSAHPALGSTAFYGSDLHRTAMSWTRSVLDVALGALVLLRLAATRDNLPVVLLSVTLLVAAGALVLPARARANRTLETGRPGDGKLPAAVAGLAVAVISIGLLLVLTS